MHRAGYGRALPGALSDTIFARGDHNYPPFEFIGPEGKPDGFNVDIIGAVAAAMGIEVQIKLGVWHEVRRDLEKGDIDLLLGMFNTPERGRVFDFSVPIFTASYAVYVRHDSDIGGMDDLKDRTVILQKGDLAHDYATENHIAHQIIEKRDWTDVLLSLSKGEGDAALVSRLQGNEFIASQKLDNIRAVGPPVIQRQYCMAVTKGNSLLLAKINEGLRLINTSGEYDRIYHKWFGVMDREIAVALIIRRIALWVVLPFSALLVIAIGFSWLLRRQVKRKTCELKESEQRFRSIITVSHIGAWEYHRDKDYLWCSLEYFSILGRNRDEYAMDGSSNLAEAWTALIHPEDRDRATTHFAAYLAGGSVEMYENYFRMKHRDGSWVWIWSRGQTLRDGDGRPSSYTVGTHMDITERKRSEEEKEKLQNQLNQAQKMESVGRLAGGVAHDFNNMLGVIMGHAEMAQERAGKDEQLRADLDEILKAAERSADLTRQLLAFARKQTVHPMLLDLNETVEGILKMLRRLIGENIDLAWLPDKKIDAIFIDPSQIDQILANLCVNARDAIENTGKITIETHSAAFDEAYCGKHSGFVPGEYVLLAVSDNGCGMDRETQSHIFEPFFTTKGMGKGTGLGLATVYGIVKQNNGFINVYSEPGQGTAFHIYLPRHAAKAAPRTEQEQAAVPAACGETILLVEDEPAILKMTLLLLGKLGYAVIAAASPDEAIRLAKEHTGPIHLLMTDVVMPEVNGRDLAENLLHIYPDIRCLFMSGYTADVIAHHGVLEKGVHFIQKPFSEKQLSVMVREALHL